MCPKVCIPAGTPEENDALLGAELFVMSNGLEYCSTGLWTSLLKMAL